MKKYIKKLCKLGYRYAGQKVDKVYICGENNAGMSYRSNVFYEKNNRIIRKHELEKKYDNDQIENILSEIRYKLFFSPIVDVFRELCEKHPNIRVLKIVYDVKSKKIDYTISEEEIPSGIYCEAQSKIWYGDVKEQVENKEAIEEGKLTEKYVRDMCEICKEETKENVDKIYIYCTQRGRTRAYTVFLEKENRVYIPVEQYRYLLTSILKRICINNKKLKELKIVYDVKKDKVDFELIQKNIPADKIVYDALMKWYMEVKKEVEKTEDIKEVNLMEKYIKEMCRLSCEYVERNADKIYIFGVRKSEDYYIDAFYEKNDKVALKTRLNNLLDLEDKENSFEYDISHERSKKYFVPIIKLFRSVCKTYENLAVLKVVYDVKKQTFSYSISEEKIKSRALGYDRDMFLIWYQEIKKQVENK